MRRLFGLVYVEQVVKFNNAKKRPDLFVYIYDPDFAIHFDESFMKIYDCADTRAADRFTPFKVEGNHFCPILRNLEKLFL